MTNRAKPWRILPAAFFQRDVLVVARDLLGKGLLLQPPHAPEPLLAEISEVEAYMGDVDPASHTFRGETPRNRSMFSGGGTLYVYISYGMHFCMNVVTGAKGSGHAVLLRAARPLLGVSVMARRRGIELPIAAARNVRFNRQLLGGPGKLAQAFGVDRSLDGVKLGRESGIAVVALAANAFSDLGGTIRVTPRIGISKAVDLPYRLLFDD